MIASTSYCPSASFLFCQGVGGWGCNSFLLPRGAVDRVDIHPSSPDPAPSVLSAVSPRVRRRVGWIQSATDKKRPKNVSKEIMVSMLTGLCSTFQLDPYPCSENESTVGPSSLPSATLRADTSKLHARYHTQLRHPFICCSSAATTLLVLRFAARPPRIAMSTRQLDFLRHA